MSELVQVTQDGAIATITIDNPPVNALSRLVVSGLGAALDAVRNDPSVRVVLVRGGGQRAFVAGADIKEFIGASDDTADSFRNVLGQIELLRKPVVAVIDGLCLGGGLELALACDIRIAAETAQLGQPEVKLGLLPGAGGTQRLPRAIGFGRALLMNLSGDPISAAEAYEWGLVEQVTADQELETAALALAKRLAEQSPATISVIKDLMVATRDLPLADGLAEEAGAFLRCMRSDDGVEGVAAFVEKRRPNWSAG